MTIYIVDIEPLETRYTKQWKEHLPKQLTANTTEPVVIIDGGETPPTTTPGAFLNFGGTNVYKSRQMMKISEMVTKDEIKPGDYFLFTDAWNPCVIQLKYMKELLGLDIQIGGMWHAGSYDPHDFLGRLIGDRNWVRHSEYAMFDCYDHNYFATEFHIDMFTKGVLQKYDGHSPAIVYPSIVQTGWPMEYLEDTMKEYKGIPKENIVLFPHRVAPEKQPEIFKDLAESLPEYEFIVCQEQNLSKHQYHSLLGSAKVVFSANLQETLGISWYEGALVDTIPMVPDRLSYTEMATDDFKYNERWTSSFQNYQNIKPELIAAIRDRIENYDKYHNKLGQQRGKLESFFSGEKLYNTIKNRSSRS